MRVWVECYDSECSLHVVKLREETWTAVALGGLYFINVVFIVFNSAAACVHIVKWDQRVS